MSTDFLLSKILVIPAILVAFTFKGWVQAKTAIRLGDNTPKQYGRDTFNPLKHIDIIGFFCMLMLSFGWTKPMQIDRRNFKNYYKDDLKVRFAGLGSNLVVGFVATFMLAAFITFVSSENQSELNLVITKIIMNIAILNCTWLILNMLPIPGFEGYNIIIDFLGHEGNEFAGAMQKYNMVIFLGLILPLIGGNSILYYVVGVPGQLLFSMFLKLAFIIF